MADRRTVLTRIGEVACPQWCRDDHGDVDLGSTAFWHASAPIGPEALLHPNYVEGSASVQLRQFVVLDGATGLSTDPVTVNFGIDDDYNEGGGHFSPSEALIFARALIEAASLAQEAP